MRIITLLLCSLPFRVFAQPGISELLVVFVHDTDGRPMTGTYAMPVAAQAWLSKPSAPAWSVEMHFTVSKEYPYSPHEIGTHKFWPLSPDTVHAGRREHLRFSILDCFCTDQYLLVIQGDDTMRVDMPNDPTTRGHLVHRMVARGGGAAAPEVMRFAPGRFNFVVLAENVRYKEVEERIAASLLRDARKRAKRIVPTRQKPAMIGRSDGCMDQPQYQGRMVALFLTTGRHPTRLGY